MIAVKLFLQGRSGVGKSYMLSEILTPYVQMIAGFSVQRLIENGSVIGFRAVCIDGQIVPQETKYVPGLSGVFILKGQRDVSVLDEIILKVEKDSRNPRCKLVLMDEIGGMEMTSEIFMNTLSRILTGNKPCCGVLKAWENLAHTCSVLRLEDEYDVLHSGLESTLRRSGKLITVSEENYFRIHNLLTEFFYSLIVN